MLNEMVVAWMLLLAAAPAAAQLSASLNFPNVSIGINLGGYPQLVAIPGYPVYYAPQMNSNYFFYDGMYWVFLDDSWYASDWYNGPWQAVPPEFVPVYVLRVPVRYYRQPPMYFQGWRANSPPRWDEHWGDDWAQRRRGWDHWNRNAAPRPAPLPTYQRNYAGAHYPPPAQQQELKRQQYRYQPRDPVVRQLPQIQQPDRARESRQDRKDGRPPARNMAPQESPPVRQTGPAQEHMRPQPQQYRGEDRQRPNPQPIAPQPVPQHLQPPSPPQPHVAPVAPQRAQPVPPPPHEAAPRPPQEFRSRPDNAGPPGRAGGEAPRPPAEQQGGGGRKSEPPGQGRDRGNPGDHGNRGDRGDDRGR